MDADLLAKIAGNKKKALARKRQRESPETVQNNSKNSSKNTSPSKPQTPALTDAILALATEFTAFREQVSKRQKVDDQVSSQNHLPEKSTITNESTTLETTPVFRSRNKLSRIDRQNNANNGPSPTTKLSFNESNNLPSNLPSSSTREKFTKQTIEKNKTINPTQAALKNNETETENCSQAVFTSSFFENIDTSENEASINGDDLPSNITDSEMELSRLSSERSKASFNESKSSQFDFSEFEASQDENSRLEIPETEHPGLENSRLENPGLENPVPENLATENPEPENSTIIEEFSLAESNISITIEDSRLTENSRLANFSNDGIVTQVKKETNAKKEDYKKEEASSISSLSISPEQKLKIQRNKQLALQRRNSKNNNSKR